MNSPRIHDAKFQIWNYAWRKSFLRKLDHLRRSVDANNEAAWHGLGNFGGDLAIAAADIENAFAAATIEFGN